MRHHLRRYLCPRGGMTDTFRLERDSARSTGLSPVEDTDMRPCDETANITDLKSVARKSLWVRVPPWTLIYVVF